MRRAKRRACGKRCMCPRGCSCRRKNMRCRRKSPITASRTFSWTCRTRTPTRPCGQNIIPIKILARPTRKRASRMCRGSMAPRRWCPKLRTCGDRSANPRKCPRPKRCRSPKTRRSRPANPATRPKPRPWQKRRRTCHNCPTSSHPSRPLRRALAQRDQVPGPQAQQDGGVARRALWSSLDVKATPFGDYDRAIIESVTQRWYDLLDSRRFAQDRSGKVMLRFKLKYDGTIIEMHTLENTVGELLGYLCQEAIEEAAPFAAWPPDMVRMIGANYREITFTFYYY